MKRKICYITTISLTIKAFFIPQLKYLAKNGYDVAVICSPDDGLQEMLGDEIRFIPVEIARGISPQTLMGSIKKLKAVFEKEKFDIVQYSTPNAAFCASIAAKLAKIKVRNYHLMGLRYLGADGILRFVLKLIEKITCKISTHIECVTKSNLDLSVREKLFPQKKATIVWNGSTGGVDVSRFDFEKRQKWRSEIRQSLGYKDDDFVFGFVGRITKDKGVDELLEAFFGLDGNAKLLIIGEKEGIDTLNPALWKKAQNDDRIIVHDSVADIERYYSAMDVLVLPSYREGFGMVIIEAASMGTPSIVSDIPGPVDAIIENETALTVKVKDAKELKKKMEKLLDTPDLLKKMSGACVTLATEKFDSQILCEKILERKESLIG